jgi:hypothetical protein
MTVYPVTLVTCLNSECMLRPFHLCAKNEKGMRSQPRLKASPRQNMQKDSQMTPKRKRIITHQAESALLSWNQERLTAANTAAGHAERRLRRPNKETASRTITISNYRRRISRTRTGARAWEKGIAVCEIDIAAGDFRRVEAER